MIATGLTPPPFDESLGRMCWLLLGDRAASGLFQGAETPLMIAKADTFLFPAGSVLQGPAHCSVPSSSKASLRLLC